MRRISQALGGFVRRWGNVQNAEAQRLLVEVQQQLDRLDHEVRFGSAQTLAEVAALAAAASRVAGVAAAAPPVPSPPTGGPLVSVIVPAHGAAPLLSRALQSVLAQTFRHFECIVVNDGSDERVAAGFATVAADPRFRLLSIDRQGVCGARNAGLAAATGDLVAFLDADNGWTPWNLAATVDAFDDPSVHISYSAMLIERSGGIVDARSQPFDREALLRECFIDLNCLVHRRVLGGAEVRFDEHIERLTDWDYVAALTALHPAVHLRHVGCIYDDRSHERISTTRPMGPSWYAIRSKWRGRPAAGQRIVWVAPASPTRVWSPGAPEIAALRELGADVEVWWPAAGRPFADVLATVPVDAVHFGTRNLAVRYRSAVPIEVPVVVHERGSHSGVFVPASIPPRTETARRRDVVAVLAIGDARERLDEVLTVAAASPSLRFHVAVPSDSRSRALARWVEAAAQHPNVTVIGVSSVAEVAVVCAGAGISLHPSAVSGPFAARATVALAGAAGCVPFVRSGAAPSLELSTLSFAGVADAVERLAEAAQWSDAEWRDRQRWALDAAWMRQSAPEVLLRYVVVSK